MPKEEWVAERDPSRIAQKLSDTAKAVREQGGGGRDMNTFTTTTRSLLLQHMLWHQGYHHGQIKLALKVAGRPLTDEEAGPVTWGVRVRKKLPSANSWSQFGAFSSSITAIAQEVSSEGNLLQLASAFCSAAAVVR